MEESHRAHGSTSVWDGISDRVPPIKEKTRSPIRSQLSCNPLGGPHYWDPDAHGALFQNGSVTRALGGLSLHDGQWADPECIPPWAFKNKADYYKANPLFSVPIIVDDYDGFVGGCSKPTTVRLLEIDQPTLIEKDEILVVPESGSTKRKRKPKKTMEEVEEIKSNSKRPKPANGPSLRLSSSVGRGRGRGRRGRGRGRSTLVCGESQLETELLTISQAVDGVGLVIDRESSKGTGLGKSLTVQTLKEITRSHDLSFVFLSETNKNDNYVNKVRRQLGFSKDYHVPPINTAGGLSLWWRPNYKVEVVDYSNFFIDTLITYPGSATPFRVTWMYDPPYGEDKAAFWEKCSDLRDWGDALRGVAPVITDEMNDDLGRPFTYDEVRDAAFQLGVLKAPGPDGFPGLFYHKYWGIVNEIIRTTSSDFLAGKMKHLMSLLLGITCTDQPGVYLGLPTFWGRSKNGALAYIKEKVANKMDGWKEKVLTQAGKEVLIKSVALAIPSFPMSCFRFPKGNISHLIQQADLNHILSIPIGRREDPDRRIWPLTKHGTFTLKSAYHWYHHMQSTTPISKYGSSHTIDTRCWKLIWKLPTHPKIRHFFWKALNTSTPTYLSLYRRKIIKSLLCPVCGVFEESIEHAIFMCPWVDLVWFGSPLGLKIDKHSYTTLDIWLLQVIKKFNSKKVRQWVILTLVCFFTWSIWKARCRFVYQHIPISPTIVIQLGWEAASEFMASTNPTAESPMSEQVLN
ncbi:hypothetical protein ACLB2K_052870 [Fragaria x ananassa]